MKSPLTGNNFRLLRNAYQNVSGEIQQIMGSILFSIDKNFIIGPRGLHIILGKLLKIKAQVVLKLAWWLQCSSCWLLQFPMMMVLQFTKRFRLSLSSALLISATTFCKLGSQASLNTTMWGRNWYNRSFNHSFNRVKELCVRMAFSLWARDTRCLLTTTDYWIVTIH